MDHDTVPISREELSELKRQGRGVQGAAPSKDLEASLENLSRTMTTMLDLFKTAADDLRLEDRDQQQLSKSIGPIIEKLNAVIDQNKIIAEGMLAIADMVKDIRSSMGQSHQFPPIQRTAAAPQPPSYGGTMPWGSPDMGAPLPPPPGMINPPSFD